MIFDHKIDPKENKNQVNEYHYKNLLMKFSKYIKLKTSQIVSYKSAPELTLGGVKTSDILTD